MRYEMISFLLESDTKGHREKGITAPIDSQIGKSEMLSIFLVLALALFVTAYKGSSAWYYTGKPAH